MSGTRIDPNFLKTLKSLIPQQQIPKTFIILSVFLKEKSNLSQVVTLAKFHRERGESHHLPLMDNYQKV